VFGVLLSPLSSLMLSRLSFLMLSWLSSLMLSRLSFLMLYRCCLSAAALLSSGGCSGQWMLFYCQ